jgi:hypothetical protein
MIKLSSLLTKEQLDECGKDDLVIVEENEMFHYRYRRNKKTKTVNFTQNHQILPLINFNASATVVRKISSINLPVIYN